MRRVLLAGACLLALSGRAHADVPVIDNANLIEWGTSIGDQ